MPVIHGDGRSYCVRAEQVWDSEGLPKLPIKFVGVWQSVETFASALNCTSSTYDTAEDAIKAAIMERKQTIG